MAYWKSSTTYSRSSSVDSGSESDYNGPRLVYTGSESDSDGNSRQMRLTAVRSGGVDSGSESDLNVNPTQMRLRADHSDEWDSGSASDFSGHVMSFQPEYAYAAADCSADSGSESDFLPPYLKISVGERAGVRTDQSVTGARDQLPGETTKDTQYSSSIDSPPSETSITSSVSIEISIPFSRKTLGRHNIRRQSSSEKVNTDWLQKEDEVDQRNLLSSYSFARATQTSPENEWIPTPPIVCEEWEATVNISWMGGCLQKPGSDVVLRVPYLTIDDGCYADFWVAICANIDQIQRKLKFPSNEFIISPLAEYWAEPSGSFPWPVRIDILSRLSPSYEVSSVNVYCVTRSHDGRIHLCKVDDWTLSDKSALEIFTDHFSAYICTSCNLRQSPVLTVVVCGHRTQGSDGHHEALVSAHVWNDRLDITDFQQEYIKDKILATETLSLLEDHLQDSDLHFALRIIGRDGKKWQHSTDNNGDIGFPVEQTVDIRKLLTCENQKCNEWRPSSHPSTISWVLETIEDCNPDALLLNCAVAVCHAPKGAKPAWEERDNNTSVTRLGIQVKEKLDHERDIAEQSRHVFQELMGLPTEKLEGAVLKLDNGDRMLKTYREGKRYYSDGNDDYRRILATLCLEKSRNDAMASFINSLKSEKSRQAPHEMRTRSSPPTRKNKTGSKATSYRGYCGNTKSAPSSTKLQVKNKSSSSNSESENVSDSDTHGENVSNGTKKKIIGSKASRDMQNSYGKRPIFSRRRRKRMIQHPVRCGDESEASSGANFNELPSSADETKEKQVVARSGEERSSSSSPVGHQCVPEQLVVRVSSQPCPRATPPTIWPPEQMPPPYAVQDSVKTRRRRKNCAVM